MAPTKKQSLAFQFFDILFILQKFGPVGVNCFPGTSVNALTLTLTKKHALSVSVLIRNMHANNNKFLIFKLILINI